MSSFWRMFILAASTWLWSVDGAIAAKSLTISDIEGKSHEPLVDRGQKAVVFFFLLHDCPVCNSYAAEMGRIVEEYSPRQVRFYAVQIDPDLSPADARKHASEFGIKCPVLLDRKHELVEKAKVSITPEAAVFAGPAGLVYHGRIDDTYVDFGKRRDKASVQDLRAALDAVLAGKAVEHPVTQAVGCVIGSVKK